MIHSLWTGALPLKKLSTASPDGTAFFVNVFPF